MTPTTIGVGPSRASCSDNVHGTPVRPSFAATVPLNALGYRTLQPVVINAIASAAPEIERRRNMEIQFRDVRRLIRDLLGSFCAKKGTIYSSPFWPVHQSWRRLHISLSQYSLLWGV